MNDHDQVGSKHVPSIEITAPARKNLPNRILRAFDTAKHLYGLSRSVKDTLAELCRYVSQKEPFSTIFAHKANIAKRIGASERTIFRHLQKLEEHALIEVLPQERKSRNGRFAVARIRLTGKAAALLGFSDAHIAPEAVNSPQTGLTSATDVRQNHGMTDLIHSEPYDNMSAGHTLTEPTCTKNQPTPQLRNGLPGELAWMTSNGLSKAGIFKLMKMAKTAGKLLSDIVLMTTQYIGHLTGGHLYCYLSKLIAGPTCFAVAAAATRRLSIQRQEAAIFKAKSKSFRERFKNTAFTTRDQDKLYVFDDRSSFVQIFDKVNPSSWAPLNDLAGWVKAVESGRIVLATAVVERQFIGRVVSM